LPGAVFHRLASLNDMALHLLATFSALSGLSVQSGTKGKAPHSRVRVPFISDPCIAFTSHRMNSDTLKIIVTGTPKTGSTWVRHLLAALYELPMANLPADFKSHDWAAMGPRWVGQQHYHPQRELREIAAQHGIIFVTPIRHPGDVLVSLRAHMQSHASSGLTDPLHSMLLDPADVYGENSLQFVKTGFFFMLHMSIEWLRGGWSHPIRYESLWRSPVGALQALAQRIAPMPVKRVQHALCASEINLMQSTYDVRRNFVRKGGIGSWVDVLPENIRALLETHSPYPEQFAALEYTMDADDPANQRSREPGLVQHALRNSTHFANGTPFAPILLRAYFDLPDELISRWPDATADEADSFFAWLSQPTTADPDGGQVGPVIPELAWYLRSLRPDVAQAFPDPFGEDRMEFAHWFVYSAINEYKFDPGFTVPVLRSWAIDDIPLASREIPHDALVSAKADAY
jgi:hypothetical protein